jgi:hypothetical protein
MNIRPAIPRGCFLFPRIGQAALLVVAATACVVSHPAAASIADDNAPAGSQQLEQEMAELRGVVRVSWDLIDALADDSATANVPFTAEISGGVVSGQVMSKVDMTIEPRQLESTLNEGSHRSVFLVRAAGTAQGTFLATSGCFRIGGPIFIPFSAERDVMFDGRHFEAGPANVTASVNTEFSTIQTRRDGPVGRFIARVATPAILGQQASSEQQASPIARQRVADFMERYTTEIVTRLNEITPLEQSLFKLYPEMQNWRIRLSNEDDYLTARYAPRGTPPVELPEAPHRAAGIEIWIRTTAPEAKFLERLGRWQRVQNLLKAYLPAEGSDAEKLTSQTEVKSFGPWFVLLIGQVP